MRWLAGFMLCALLAASPPAQPSTASAPSSHAATVDVPAGEQIEVVLLSDVGSRLGTVGDTFAVETVNDYYVSGSLVLPKGTPGYGSITQLKHAANGHVNGTLTILINALVEPGGALLLVGVPGSIGDATVVKEHNGSTAGHWLLCGLICMAAQKGDDITLKAGTHFHVTTAGHVGVQSVSPGCTPAALDPKFISPAPSPTPSVTIEPSSLPSAQPRSRN